MSESKSDKIEFVSKVIGLVIVCSGIVASMSIVYLLIFPGTDYGQLQQISLKAPFGGREINNALYAMFQIERQMYFKALILSLLPIPFGMYLMSSNNIFVRFCYPEVGDDIRGTLFDPNYADIQVEDGLSKDEISSEDGIGYGRCPACNADIIRRKVEHGKHVGKYFLSCSNFPKCKQVFPYKNRKNEAEQPFRL